MKILVLDEEFPFPLNTGKRIRSFNLLARLAQNHSMKYLAYGKADSSACKELQAHDMDPQPVEYTLQRKGGLLFYIKLLRNLFSTLPYIVTSHYTPAFNQRLKALLEYFKPDLILAEWTPYSIYLKDIQGPKKLIVTHNIEANIWERYFLNEQNPLRKWYIRKQWQKVCDFERHMLGWADGITTVSEIERQEFHKINNTINIKVIDNGVDLDYFKPGTAEQVRPNSLVFTGSMDWRPNQDSVIYFMDSIYPLLRKERPDIRVTVVGRNPPDSILQYHGRDDITVTGTVDDVRPFIAEAALYIVPLRIGGGSRLKILEAMAMEKAVISTSIGAEGLDVQDGRHLILADDPGSFTREILRALNDADLSAGLGREGRKLVEESYGWDALAGRLEEFLAGIMAG